MKRILIVEDDKFLANALESKLVKDGFVIDVVGDGSDVSGKLDQNMPDLILLDLMLPKMDGFAVLEMLKANAAWASMPVVVITNLSQNEDFEKAKALGAADYLIKTGMSLGEVVEKVKKFL